MNYPDLSNEKIISIDIETADPELMEMGPGVYRKDGTILGVAVGAEGFSEYYSLRHRESGQDHDKNRKYLEEMLALNVPKIGANLMYDLDWLMNNDGFTVNGSIHDIQLAEPLLDEYKKSYSLDSQAEQYLGLHKKKDEMQEWCDNHKLKGDPRQYIYLMPFNIVYEYAKVDAELPLKIFKHQYEKLTSEGLLEIYDMERGLVPLMLMMRKSGVRLDRKKIAEGIGILHKQIKERKKNLYSEYGEFNLKSGKQIAKVLDGLGVNYPLTDKGNPNLDSKVLKRMVHPLCKDIIETRALMTTLNTFFIGSFSELLVNDRLHCNFNLLRSDNYGTVSGRFSSSKPNLQQIPSAEDKGVEMCRGLFMPEEGCKWGKIDWSQIEYRLITHYAEGPGANEIREQYNSDPNTDYHKWVMDMTGLDRKHAKMLNFGTAYFMGVKTCAESFGWTLEESKEFLELYHREIPFVKITRNKVVETARRRGFLRTILGRKARVSEEIRKEGKEHSFFNRLIQGSAADIMKKSMLEAWNAGVFNVLTPHLTVHDELDVSVPRTKEGVDAFCELKHIMESCVKLNVPMSADAEIGDNWYNVKECKTRSEIERETL